MVSLPRLPSAAASTALTLGAGAAAALANRGMRQRSRSQARDAITVRVPTVDGPLLSSSSYGRAEDSPGTILLAHGWTMSSAFWTATAEALERRGWHVVTYDQRGHGRSAIPPTDGYSLARLGDDVEAVLDTNVVPGRPVLLVGHSMGAMSLMAWAGRAHATRHDVRGTILVSTSAHGVVPDALAALTGTTSQGAHVLLKQVVKVPIEVPRTPINALIVKAVAFGQDPSDTAVALTHDLFLDCPPHVRVRFARQMDVLDLREGAAALHVPTVVMTGTEDKLTPPAHATALSELIPHASLRVVAGAGHQLPLERPALMVEAISGHAAAVGLRAHALTSA